MIIFNILPIYPLDGHRIYFKLLNSYFDKLYSFDLLFYISLLIAILIIIYLYIFHYYYMIILIGFLISQLIIKRKKLRQKININTIMELLK